MEGLARFVVRICLTPGHSLPVPYSYAVPPAIVLVAYVIFSRRFLASSSKGLFAFLPAIVGVIVFVLLIPDMVWTRISRARGRQPASWTFAVGDRVTRLEDKLVQATKGRQIKNRTRSRIPLLAVVLVIAAPMSAYNGAKSVKYPAFAEKSRSVLEAYENLENWAFDVHKPSLAPAKPVPVLGTASH